MALDMERDARGLPKAFTAPLAGDDHGLVFAGMLYAGVAFDGVAEADLAALAADSRETLAFMAEKPANRHKLRVRPSATGKMAVVEVLNDDMPFLVDSVMGEIQSRGLRVHLVAHPILRTLRNAAGRIQAIVGSEDRNWHDAHQESLIVVHVDPPTPETAADLGRALSEILTEVRAAVADWRAMLNRVDVAVRDLELAPLGVPAELKSESIKLVRWMQDGHFTFLGVNEVRLLGEGDAAVLAPVDGSGLGLLRDPSLAVLSRNGEDLSASAEVRRAFLAEAPLTISKASLASRVHRRVPMDYVAVKTYARGPRGSLQATGELRIVGLFTSQAYTETARTIPVLRHKIETVLQSSGYPPQSHAGKALVNVLDTIPRDELFQVGIRDLAQWANGILDLEMRPRVRLFSRTDRFGRFTSVLLYAPRDRWTSALREKIAAELASAFGGRVVDFRPSFPEGPLVRIHFILTRDRAEGSAPDLAALEERITAMMRTWDDRFGEGVRATPAGAAAAERFAGAFPVAYTDTITPDRAIEDMHRIERLAEANAPVAIDFYRLAADPPHRVRAALYRFGDPIRLSERVPILENLGFSVIDERSYVLTPLIADSRRNVALHDMTLDSADGHAFDVAGNDQRLEDAFSAVFRGLADNDVFNRLIAAAGATWREALLLRAYGAYLRQLNAPFGLRYLAETLHRHAGVARDLIELFHVRFDPDRAFADEAARKDSEAPVRARIDGALAAVPSLDEDRILRTYLNLIDATVRTNFYQRSADGQPSELVALKLDSKAIEAAPQPRPYREISVYSPRIEGVHLRFAPIARGGIRWSDRAQDFRTEVLGLVKAQLVKNAVIVPSGAKGGFLPKQLPRGGSRDEVMKEGIAAYKLFISALLDITDNLVDGKIVPPPRVVRRDGDDPYLVVAADKGTATFSDIANELSAAKGHWLGDAFASGGSVGYDHKRMAITARGAWECVKRHFREIDIDIQSTPFRVTGIGDMSGDVFGNGMLLSPVIRLVAAFDHRDIFVDPDPDPQASFAERKRMFDLPRSSWQDYDKTKLSAGGGVFSRSAKAIPLSVEMKSLFGFDADTCTPAELMRAILKCPVDLLWLGGIGTYVRAAAETDEQVGDRANDAIRVAAADLGAKVVGEGANLGVTQRGRIELAERGVRLNTDFIDNSAGVNSSDYEVNIKIALGRASRSGELEGNARKAFLATMTDDVARGCLINNYAQSLALSLMQRSARSDSPDHARLMRDLEKRRLLERSIESLPSDRALAERLKAGRPLTRPELAVLSSYTKIALTDELLASRVPDAAFAAPLLVAYFPKRLVAEFGDDVRAHRLKREIIATAVTNAVINRVGPAALTRLAEESARAWPDVATAFLAAEHAFAVDPLWRRIDALDGKVAGALQLDLYAAVQSLLHRQIAELAADGRVLTDFDGVASRLAVGAATLREGLDGPLRADIGADVEADARRFAGGGIPDELARDVALLPWLADAGRLVRIAEAAKRPIPEAARAHLAIGRNLHVDHLRRRATEIAADDPFDRLAVSQSLAQVADAQASLATRVLESGQSVEAWLAANAAELDPIRSLIERIRADGIVSVSRLTVAAGRLRAVASMPL